MRFKVRRLDKKTEKEIKCSVLIPNSDKFVFGIFDTVEKKFVRGNKEYFPFEPFWTFSERSANHCAKVLNEKWAGGKK